METKQGHFGKVAFAIFFAIIVCLTSLLLPLPGGQSAASEYFCKITFTPPPTLSGTHAGVLFAEELKKRTNGKIEPQVFPQGQLGGDPEIMNKLEMGSIQFMNTGGMMLSRWTKKADVLMLPFLFDTWDKVDKFAKSELLDPIKRDLEKKGIMLVGITAFGMMDIAATKKIGSLEDLKGTKFRIQPTPIFKKMCEYLGINGMPVPYTEVYSSLKQGIVDGVFNTSELMMLDKTCEVCKYVTNTNHMCGFIVQLLNKQWFDSLPEGLRTAVMDSINSACIEERKRVRVREFEFTNKMKTDENVTFIELEPNERERFVQALMPLHRDAEDIMGKEYMDDLYKLIDFKK
jgi:tripartite ATP-independent transporter DctP family solute receptor